MHYLSCSVLRVPINSLQCQSFIYYRWWFRHFIQQTEKESELLYRHIPQLCLQHDDDDYHNDDSYNDVDNCSLQHDCTTQAERQKKKRKRSLQNTLSLLLFWFLMQKLNVCVHARACVCVCENKQLFISLLLFLTVNQTCTSNSISVWCVQHGCLGVKCHLLLTL